MIDDKTSPISASLADEIEDAIMFGRAGDLEAIIENVSGDDLFPPDLRNGLESLSYFRNHYGKQAAPTETDKKKITLMDSAWSMELLNKIRTRIEAAVKRA